MKRSLIPLAFLAALPFAASAADGLSYNYVEGGYAKTDSTIDARLFWILTTIAASAYMLSRGIAKAATRSRAHDPREDIDPGRD